MRIDSPVMTSAIATGSFSGSFTGTFDGDIQADSVAYANVTGKPTLVSGSAQVVALVEAGTDSNTFTDADHTKLNGIEASADVTDTANVTSAGALMDSECTSLADVKALDQSVISGASPTFSTANMSDASNKRFMTDAQETKLDSVESNADVTDTANVTSAGALMDSEVNSLSGVKTLTVPDSTTISSFGASLVDDADAAAARTTLGVDAAGTDNSTDVTLANTNYLSLSGQELTGGTVPVGSGGTGATTAGAARTALGVDAAGTDNSTDVTLVTTSHDYLSLSGQAITLGTIDISDDTNLAVSDTTGQTGINLTLSGDTLSGVVSGLDTSDNVQFNNLTVAGDLTVSGTTTSINSTNLDVTDKLISINKGGADAASANGAGLYISGANESLTWDNGNSRFTFSDDLNVGGNITLSGTVDGRDVASDGTKLDGIEASADVTDTANVTAAGALMDSEVTNLAQVKAFDSSDYATAAQGTTADAALARSGGQMTGNITFSGAQTVDGRDLSADGSKLDGIEASADVTDTANVTAAGALMDSELANLAAVKAINQGLTTTSDVRFDSIGIGTAAPGTSGVVRATNDIVAFYSSDERLKDNIEEIPNALDKVESIRGVHFDWNDKQEVYEGHDIGVIAQEVEKVLPEIVEDRDNGYKAVKYEKLTAVLIQAVKELSAKVKELENK